MSMVPMWVLVHARMCIPPVKVEQYAVCYIQVYMSSIIHPQLIAGLLVNHVHVFSHPCKEKS